MTSTVVSFNTPFVIFLGDIGSETYAKTGLGLVEWRRDQCIGQVRLPGAGVDAGVRDLTVAEARARGARSLIIGSAAGVAAMGLEKIDFFWYARKIGGLALLGYLAGAAAYVVQYRLFH